MSKRRDLGRLAGLGSVAARLSGLVALLPLTAAAAEPSDPDRSWLPAQRKARASAPLGPIAGLPHAFGRQFADLDAYLEHLRIRAAPVDLPWYKEVRPDVYQQQGGRMRPNAHPPLYSREELERRFGFRR